MLTMFAVDPGGVTRGLLRPISATAILRYNDVSSFEASLATSDRVVGMLSPGWSVVYNDRGINLSGCIQSFVYEVNDGRSILRVSGRDDMVRLQDRLVYPDPMAPIDSQSVARYEATGRSAKLAKDLVRYNLGLGSTPSRRSPGVYVVEAGPDGNVTRVSERLSTVLAACQKLLTPDSLRMSMLRDPDGVAFSVQVTRDLSRRVRLKATGEVSMSAPTGNVIVVGGQGVGADRTLLEYPGDVGDWGHRVEVFKDRRDTDSAEDLEKSGRELLADGAQSHSARVKIEEHPGKIFGVDYYLGDKVSVELASVGIVESITTAKVEWGTEGRKIELSVGPEDSDAPTWLGPVKNVVERVRNMEVV